jgi:hypothetical protein
MRFASSIVVALAAVSLLSAPACRRHGARSATNDMARLQSPDPDEREDAAENLRDSGGPPAGVVPYVIAAVQRENDPKALREELLTLGASGAPEARPILEQHMSHPDEDVRRTANKAYGMWRERAAYLAGRYRVAYPTPPPRPMPGPPGAPPPPPASDGCDELAQICGKDPFDVSRCHQDLAGLPHPAVQAWADCINTLSTEPCQKAHDKCIAKVKR